MAIRIPLILLLCLSSLYTLAQLRQRTLPLWRFPQKTTPEFTSAPASYNVSSANPGTTACLRTNCSPEAFFCKMEERSRNHLRVIIKFRAGNDEAYRALIAKRPD